MTTALEGGEWSAARPGRILLPLKNPVHIVEEAWWAPGPVWTVGNSRLTGIRSPDGPAPSKWLYRLSYPAHYIRRIYGVYTRILYNIKLYNIFYTFYISKLLFHVVYSICVSVCVCVFIWWWCDCIYTQLHHHHINL